MVQTKTAIRDRYAKLRHRAEDPKSSEAERQKARTAADKIKRDHPWVDKPATPRDTVDQKSRPARPPLADILAKGASAMAAAWVTQRVEHAGRTIDTALDNAFRTVGVDLEDIMDPNRQSNADLVDGIDVSGAVLPTGEREEDDVIAVVLLMDPDAANALLDRATDGSRKLNEAVAARVFQALEATLQDGEFGAWPFGDEDEG